MAREVAVQIRDLVKVFGRTVAVDGLNLDIYEGEIFGLLGPNGSGKTTTLLTTATIYKPTSGDVYVHGYSVSRQGDIVRRYVGIAFQEPKALWIDNPYDLLLWHARVVGYSSSEAKEVVREVMELLDLWEHRRKQFYQLSGGTRKKLEIAKVLIQKPRVAIFDEPTAQVDVVTKHTLWDVIRSLRKEGATVIIATNDVLEAERICERIGIIFKGKLRALGTVSELKDRVPSGDVIEISFEGPEEEVRKVISSIPGIGSYTIANHKARMFLNRGEEKAVSIIQALAGSGIKVRKIMIQEPTLDDVFFYFTGARLREEHGAA
jgi:ABC-2 type transport system ATP-binding protein